MGVINITPDSFSDGGIIFDRVSLIEKIKFLKKSGVKIIDIGAQSTAPKSAPISVDEEIARFEKFLIPILKDWDSDLTLSIDTFRPEVFLWLYRENPSLNWIFNDISGHLDENVLNFCENAKVIVGHNLCQTREEAPNHLKYISKQSDLILHMETFFKSKKLGPRIIIDPLFGFSKTFEQNLELLKSLPDFIKRFSFDQEFLIGISKKSFLRKSLPQSDDPMKDSEYLHLLYLVHFMKIFRNHHLIFRVHDPKIFKLAKYGMELIENNHTERYIVPIKEFL
jgi:dihydropteroate synthase